MRRDDALRALRCAAAAAALIVALAPAGRAQDGDADAGKKKGEGSRYEVIKWLNPFSPEPPKKPEPPKPPPPPEPEPEPVRKEKVAPDNIHLAGVFVDHVSGNFVALAEVDGSKARFLHPGDKVGAFEVVRVGMDGMRMKMESGDLKAVSVGDRFHDGVTYIERVVGGGGSSTTTTREPSSSSSSSSSSPVDLDEARRRELIEKLRKRRQEALQGK